MSSRSVVCALILSLLGTSVLPGCIRKKHYEASGPIESRTFVIYGLFDSEDVYSSAIQEFQKENRGVDVVYKKFTDPQEYLELIVNEIAEGEGPDVFFMHNSWMPKHYKKLSPAPKELVDPEVFEATFVEVTANDFVIPNEEGTPEVWGIPLYVDSLALYYNDEHLEEALPQQGRPSATWEGIQKDVVALNRPDQSFERFERTGIALGRHDNILRASDILMSMMLQYKVDFYDDDLKDVEFDRDPSAISALEMYVSFALSSQKNYSWNKFLADPESEEKELTAFAKGKTSMIMGYSYTYEDISKEIARLRSLGEETIDLTDVKVQETPQAFDPESSKETKEAFASYFAPVVSRTSPDADLAWEFVVSMADEDFLREYNEETNRPSAMRALITEQLADPIYGVFAAQVGYAESIPMTDAALYEEYFLTAIEEMLSRTLTTDQVIDRLGENIQALIPLSGIKPTYVDSE